jgi:hypothetical protein
VGGSRNDVRTQDVLLQRAAIQRPRQDDGDPLRDVHDNPYSSRVNCSSDLGIVCKLLEDRINERRNSGTLAKHDESTHQADNDENWQ